MTRDKEIVYVNGDSFTAGSDLGDYLIPGYPDEYSLDDFMCGTISKSMNDYSLWREDYFNVNAETDFLIRTEQANKWSSKLAEIIDKPVINKAYPGSDNFSIFARTCNDVEKLKLSGYKVTNIIIQVTGFMRYSYVRSAEFSSHKIFEIDVKSLDRLELGDGFFLRHLIPVQIGSSRITEKESEFLKKSFYEEIIYEGQPSDANLISKLLNLKMYKDAVYGATGIEPIIVDSLFMLSYLKFTKTEKYLENKDSYVSKLFRNIFSDNITTMFNIPDFNAKSITGGGHFTSKVHEKFAALLAERYFK
jgi:hypothetical protein